MRLMNSKSGSKDRKINHELSGLKMRRSPHIVMYFRRGRLIAENYLTRRTFRINIYSLVLLNFFSTWKTASDASRNFRDYSRESISVSIQNLRDSGLLVTGESDPDSTEHASGRNGSGQSRRGTTIFRQRSISPTIRPPRSNGTTKDI
jgi:hypothetical protein